MHKIFFKFNVINKIYIKLLLLPVPLISAFQLNLISWSSQNLSNLPFKLFTDSALTTTSGKLFHSVLTLLEKLNLRLTASPLSPPCPDVQVLLPSIPVAVGWLWVNRTLHLHVAYNISLHKAITANLLVVHV